jgi:hypothetical protein
MKEGKGKKIMMLRALLKASIKKREDNKMALIKVKNVKGLTAFA